MRNIAEIIEDDKNGKQLSQTERQIAVAYIQGKYDAVRELKIGSNSNTDEALDKIRAEIVSMDFDFGDYYDHTDEIIEMVCKVIDKYKAKPKDIEAQATEFLAEARACAEIDEDRL